MFEREAEEYVRKIRHDVINWDGAEHEERFYNEIKFKQAYLAGAEFGYNQGKANEWHRVSDKLPALDAFVYLWKKGDDFPVVARRHLPYGQKEWVWDCMWGSGYTMSQSKGKDYLWKEIVLPKEIKNDSKRFEKGY